jgi:hypothetical protein
MVLRSPAQVLISRLDARLFPEVLGFRRIELQTFGRLVVWEPQFISWLLYTIAETAIR